jgi:hypothetical protein
MSALKEPKDKQMYGLLMKTESGYLLKVSAMDMAQFEGPTEEDCISQAKAAYLEYYSTHPEEQARTKQKVVWWEIELPDDAD